MKYFSLQSVNKAYKEISNCTKEKFWGILGILYSINKQILPNVGFNVNTEKLSSFLENTFRLKEKKTYNDTESVYNVVFSNKWVEVVVNDYIVGKPNIMPIIIWAYRRNAFNDNITATKLLELFINDFHLQKEFVEQMFVLNIDSYDVKFEHELYNDENLFVSLGGNLSSNLSTIKMNKSFVVANAGDLSRGPFFQPLYASLNSLKCLTIYPFDINGFYSVSNTKPYNTNNYIGRPLQQIYYGAPGTGKSHEIKEMTEGKRVVRTTFHPDSDYSTFVGAYKPTTVEVPMRDVTGKVIMENGKPVTENRIVYEFVEQAFLQAYIKAWELYVSAMEDGKEAEEVFLVIEEINRGNCAQIFGDLFQLLDRGDNGFSEYHIVADKDLQKLLKRTFENINIKGVPAVCGMSAEEVAQKIENGEILLLPNNLYIWATMNTSDQSLFPIDSAFKRRWDWHYMPISDGEKDWKIEANGKRYDWWEFLQKVNEQIGTVTNSEDKKLGYYFCKSKNGVIDAETFVGKVIFYLWNDVFKDIIEETGTMFNDADGKKLSFNRFYTVENGKTMVVEDAIERFLLNLGVESVEDTTETEEIAED